MPSEIPIAAPEDRAQVRSAGLCTACNHLQVLRSSRGSTFIRCALSDRDEAYPRYPRLPMLQCGGWEPFQADADSDSENADSENADSVSADSASADSENADPEDVHA